MAKHGKNWSPDQIELLVKHYPLNTAESLVDFLNHSKSSIYKKAQELKLKKSPEFFTEPTCGRMTESPIGKEFINGSGYLVRKVNNDLPHTKRWKPVHVIMWEKHHGLVPEGCMVGFRDGNKRNICIENLELISRRENLDRNSIQRFPKEVIEVLQLQCKLKRTIERRMKDA